ncbi:pyrroline-5-carboxylate reductase 1, mitochondrial isoform X2 [Temnothorax nylanderi]|uniref:pyrroline-5-carboxylate reductase 1, mitochondrial isoform X2 n=1 Tax=Temnothorax nylanderi TaxID=102681 RepID=UPI003A8C6F38
MAEQYLKSIKVGFIGGGNMASAIGAGLIHKGILKADNVWVSGRTDRTHGFWRDLGAHPTLKNNEVMCNCDIIFLTVKPHMLDDVLETVVGRKAGEKFESKLFVSVLAGVSLDVLYTKLSTIVTSPRIIRSMPNTPMMVGEGITESLMNGIGGVSGSGPAFAYLVIEALADGAVRMGVPRPMATKFAAQVLVGAGKMVLETGRHPGQLKDEVCSPGGTTITGIHAMEVGGVRGSIMNAVEAAVNKTNELTSRLN